MALEEFYSWERLTEISSLCNQEGSVSKVTKKLKKDRNHINSIVERVKKGPSIEFNMNYLKSRLYQKLLVENFWKNKMKNF